MSPQTVKQELEELWETIWDFPQYEISNHGQVYNIPRRRYMKTSVNNHGHVKISLVNDRTQTRHTRSVAKLVAAAFVESPNERCNDVVILDGNPRNVVSSNLAWRPRWFCWKYLKQLENPKPLDFKKYEILNVHTQTVYRNVIECGMTEGLLFMDIWLSVLNEAIPHHTFPYGHRFQILE